MGLSRVWQVRPRIAARGYQLIRGTRSSAYAANGFCLTAGTVRQSRDWEYSPAWRSSRKSVAPQWHEIVLGHSWKGGMNTSIFQFAPHTWLWPMQSNGPFWWDRFKPGTDFLHSGCWLILGAACKYGQPNVPGNAATDAMELWYLPHRWKTVLTR
jgi:hypothetical protein